MLFFVHLFFQFYIPFFYTDNAVYLIFPPAFGPRAAAVRGRRPPPARLLPRNFLLQKLRISFIMIGRRLSF